MKHRNVMLSFVLLALLMPVVAQARLELPLVFSKDAMLQRDQPMKVWGWSTPGAAVRVSFDGAKAKAVAATDGRWDVTLPAHAAGGPYTLTIDDGSEQRTVDGVLVGDVWLCSGQSNMEFMVAQARDASVEQAQANDPAIRQFKIPHSWSPRPQDRLAGGAWVPATPETVGEFSAVCWFFAREIRARTGAPQGLVNSSWGGSRIEAWMDGRTTDVDPEAMASTLRRAQAEENAKLASTRQRLAAWPAQQGDVLDARGLPAWAAAQLDESAWVPIEVPAYWETVGYSGMDGVAWYRTHFKLSAAEAARGVTLGLGTIDDSDHSWVNGQLVGETIEQPSAMRAYKVAPGLLHKGSNTIAIRVDDLGADGGIHGDAALLYVQPEGGPRRSLNGPWRFRPAYVTLVPMQNQDQNQIATLLYNKMINPLRGFPLRGVLWYQGESNAQVGQAVPYRKQFAAMIHAWREAWKNPDLPFFWVQLPNFKSGSDTPTESPWAELRESQSAALSLPHTGQAVIIDLGNPDDIHPVDKQDVGHRLALAVRYVVYGESLVDAGPTFRTLHVEGNQVALTFDLHGSALAVRGGGTNVAGFEVAGADQHYHSAQAHIDGERVVVFSSSVSAPVTVRYAWSDNPVDANLINRDGLPASPFRTTSHPQVLDAPTWVMPGSCAPTPAACQSTRCRSLKQILQQAGPTAQAEESSITASSASLQRRAQREPCSWPVRRVT